MKYLLLLLLSVGVSLAITSSTAEQHEKLKPDEAWICTAWRGSADPSQNSPSVCIKWTKKDCSQRLHKDICKRHG